MNIRNGVAVTTEAQQFSDIDALYQHALSGLLDSVIDDTRGAPHDVITNELIDRFRRFGDHHIVDNLAAFAATAVQRLTHGDA